MTQTKSSKEYSGFESYLDDSMSFDEYIDLIESLLAEGKTTGPNQSEELVNFGRLNRQRMRRLAKTSRILPETAEAAALVSRPMVWLILTEGWCGDAAQNIPVIEKIAAESDLIMTGYLLRDDNPGLMDMFLTDGVKSIPKLICVDAETHEILGDWGSRPLAAQEYFAEMKQNGFEKADMLEKIQRWYLADKEQSIQKEFITLLNQWR